MSMMSVKLNKDTLPYRESISNGYKNNGDICASPLSDSISPNTEEVELMLKFSPLMVFSGDSFIGLLLSNSKILYTCSGNKSMEYLNKFKDISFRQVYYGYNSANMPVFLDTIKSNCDFTSLDRMYFDMIYGAEFYRFIMENNKGFSKAPLSAQLFDRSILDEDHVFYDRFDIKIEQFNKRFRSTS